MTGKQLLDELNKERYDEKGLAVGYYTDDGTWLDLQSVTLEDEKIVLRFPVYYDDAETETEEP